MTENQVGPENQIGPGNKVGLPFNIYIHMIMHSNYIYTIYIYIYMLLCIPHCLLPLDYSLVVAGAAAKDVCTPKMKECEECLDKCAKYGSIRERYQKPSREAIGSRQCM